MNKNSVPNQMASRLAAAAFLFLVLLPAACRPGIPSAHVLSSSFNTLEEKKAFLERYVTFRRKYEKLDYLILFRNGNDGRVPSPSEWDLRLAARVPPETLDAWIAGLEELDAPDTGWIKDIPDATAEPGAFRWYGGTHRQVGIDREKSLVLYRNHAF